MASGPTIPQTPLELFENNIRAEPPLLSKYFIPTACATVAFVAMCFANWGSRRPMFSGIQKHVTVTALGAGIGKYVDDYRNKYLADRDAVFRHYIQLHPDDFPPYERKQLKDILEPWYPIR